ncbi:MAG: Phosphoglycerate mutase [Herbinix sp.]|jgi:probable phosphoglycerate mutase|nr:Phosphoglycerate mutase [Herbinix sp.]
MKLDQQLPIKWQVKENILMKILFVRHGDPDYEKDYLTEKGFKEAHLLADRLTKLNVRDFYCSPLGRARATAKVTLDRLGREATVCDWLREFPGTICDEDTMKYCIPWDLMPGKWTHLPNIYDKDKWFNNPVMASGDVEEVYKNITINLDLFLEHYGYHRDGNYYSCKKSNKDTIVIFCHLGVQFAILSHLLGIAAPLLWQGFFVAPTSITTLVTEERVKGEAYFRCQALGDTSHLYIGNEPISTVGFFQETWE